MPKQIKYSLKEVTQNNFSQKQLLHKMKLGLVIIKCAGYIFW